ncbi:MAG: ABC transporter permease [Acidimicrobiia bacterium]|nr:ABC transporter permease [Acidimicrobiia bacterium]
MLLALREIARAKIRFGLLAGAVGLLVFLILFQQGLLGGLVTNFIGAVDNQRSPILVFNDQARSNVEGSFLTSDQADAVAAVDGVGESGLIGEGTYTVDAGDEIQDAVLFGYELGGLGEPLTLDDGRLPEGPDEGVASSADADKGFAVGDTVEIVGADGSDGPRIEIVGTGDKLRWSVSPTVFVSYETFEAAQSAVNPDAPVVFPSLVAVEPADGVDTDELTDRIDAEVPGTEALTRQEAVDRNPGVQGVNQSFGIILLLAFLVVALVVGFFFLILTVQKAKSLTLLRAVGAPSGYLVRNLLVQITLVLGAGVAVGLGLVTVISALDATGNVAVDLEMRTALFTILGLAVISLLGGLASIRRVLKIDPLRATLDSGREI